VAGAMSLSELHVLAKVFLKSNQPKH